MNEKKNSDILALESNKTYPESRNLESSAQRGKQINYIQWQNILTIMV